MLRIAALAGSLVLALPAHAQVVVEAFGGLSSSDSRSAAIRTDDARVDGTLAATRIGVNIERLKLAPRPVYGVRLGYWAGMIGVAVDAATLNPDVREQTITATTDRRFDQDVFGERVVIEPGYRVTVKLPRLTVPTTGGIAALAMVRLPRGRVRPYAFAGPTYVITDTDLSGAWGLRAGGGLRVALTRSLGVFGEYRYTRVNASAVAGRIDTSIAGISGDSGETRVDVKLRQHAMVGGISLHL